MPTLRTGVASSLVLALVLQSQGGLAQVARAPSTDRAGAASPPAPDPDVARAQELKALGDREMDSLHYPEALEAYTEANRLAPSVALLYNRGRVLQALGIYPEALHEIERFAAEAPPSLKAQVPGLPDLLVDLRSKVTMLSVVCDVPGVQLRLNDRLLGPTPLQVVAGRAVLEASADGYFPARRELLLAGGGSASVELHLKSKQVSGILYVTSPVVGADLSIDGAEVGKVPVETVVTAGAHSLALTHEGFHRLETVTVVTAGQRKDLSIPLEMEKGIASRWWFWTSLGVVAVAGGAIAAALLSTRGPGKGTIAPGTVSTGLASF